MSSTVPGVKYGIVGDAYVDLFCFLEGDFPQHHGGDSRLNRPIETFAGGSSTNTATHLKALIDSFVIDSQEDNTTDNTPAPEVHLTTVLNPDDHYGQMLLDHADKHGFQVTNCRKPEDNSSTGHCIAIVSGGERSFMTHQGVVGSFEADDIPQSQFVDMEDNMPSNLHLHVAGYFNIPGFWNGTLKKVLEEIRKNRAELYPGLTTTFSLVAQFDATQNWDGGIDDILQTLDFVILNDLECRNIVQRGLRQRGEELPAVAEDFHDLQGWAEYFGTFAPKCNVIVTRGERGAVALRDGIVIANQTAVIVKNPVDPTGAGDSFTAGFLHGLWTWKSKHPNFESYSSKEDSPSLEWPVDAIRDGLRWGCAVGAAAVLIRGASVPPKPEDVKSYYLSGVFDEFS